MNAGGLVDNRLRRGVGSQTGALPGAHRLNVFSSNSLSVFVTVHCGVILLLRGGRCRSECGIEEPSKRTTTWPDSIGAPWNQVAWSDGACFWLKIDRLPYGNGCQLIL